MKIATEDFARLAAGAAATAKENHAVPAGTMAMLYASDGMLTVTATDFEYWLTMRAPCEGDLAACMVPANKLADVAGKLSADNVDVTLEGDALHIKAGRSKRKLSALPADSFPVLPNTQGDAVTLDGARVRECFAYCMPFLKPSGRAFEQGVNIDGSRMRGTDGHTVAQINYGDAEMPAVTVPAAFSRAFDKIVPDGEITLIVSEKAVAVEWPEGRISGPVVEGQYPDTDRIMGGIEGTTKLTVAADELASAVRGVRQLADGRAAIGLNIEPGGVDVFARSQSGEATDRIEAMAEGSLIIGFNADYVDRVMRGFGKAVVQIAATDPKAPVMVTSDEASDRLAIIMPMRI